MKYKRYLSLLLVGSMAVSVTPVNAEAIISLDSEKKATDSVTSDSAIYAFNAEDFDDVANQSSEAVTYSVPVKMVQAANPSLASMGSGAVDGDAIVTVSDGKAVITLNFKAVKLAGLYGHLLRLWSYPVTDNMDYTWWNNSEYETAADIAETYSDYGLNYTTGDTTMSEFAKSFKISRDIEKEDSIYIRISVDAMAGFDQAARLDFDWENATIPEDADEDNTEDKTEEIKLNAPVIAVEKNMAKNGEEVEIGITSDNENADIYYTTDGTMPSETSEKYNGSFKIAESNKTVVINAVAISGAVKSGIGTAEVKFITSSSSSSDSDKLDDGKYRINVNLWNENIDQASMGDSAFENNRQALVTVSGNKATVELATNPVSVSGYTSAVKDIKSSEVDINIDGTSSFTTNTRYDGTAHSFDYITKFSFELSELNKEYVSVEINVPFTPMDGIVADADAYIPARLKLDWSSAEQAGANDKLTTDTTVAVGSSSSSSSGGSSTNSTSAETGIKVKADSYVLPDDVEFKTKVLTSGTEFNMAEGLIDNDFRLYSIVATSESEGGSVSPVGVAEVYIPVSDEGAKVTIYRVVEGDKNTKAGLSELEYKLSEDGKYYVVTVKEFGLFAVVSSDDTDTLAIPAFKPEQTEITEEKNIGFTDISEHWAKEYIVKSAEIGLFSGIEENIFAPDANTTRAMFVTVLGRLAGVSAITNGATSFNDVDTDDYFAPYVKWAVENGIASGVGENCFAPNEDITREQVAVMLCNFTKNNGIELKKVYKAEFTDSGNISTWAEDSVKALAEAGIISGRSDSSFDPKGTATRAEIATMLIKLVEEYM
jgi:hypothetical protein